MSNSGWLLREKLMTDLRRRNAVAIAPLNLICLATAMTLALNWTLSESWIDRSRYQADVGFPLSMDR